MPGKMIYEIKDCTVKGLYELKGLVDAIKSNPDTKLTPETNIFMLRLLIEELGASCVQKLLRILIDKGTLKWEEEDDFEVESILDFVDEGEGDAKKPLYLIKWKGWTHEHNTWEPKENLVGCEDMLEVFHCLFDQYGREGVKRQYAASNDNKEETKKLELEVFIAKLLRTQVVTADLLLSVYTPAVRSSRIKQLRERRLLKAKRKCTLDLNNKRTKRYKERKIDQKQSLIEWQAILNDVYKNEPSISVENEVDHEPQPDHFAYITKSIPMPGLEVSNDPLFGCECEDCGKNKDNCCAANAGAAPAYRSNRRLRLKPGWPIYECNWRCKCPPDCPNRVVQRGRKHKLCIFRTSDNRGWGVKTLQRIPQGCFVLEYVGEIITSEEAENRGQKYDQQAMTYLFDLDFDESENPFTIDAKKMGNVAHFINHSCDPNCQVFGVWVDHLDIRLPRIALFARREIAKGEELTFDYQMTVASRAHESDDEMEEDERESVDSSSVADDISDKPTQESNPVETATEEMEKLPQDETTTDVPLSNATETISDNKAAPEIVVTSEDGLFAKPESKVDKAPIGDVSTDSEFNLPMTPASSEHSDAESNHTKDRSPPAAFSSRTLVNKLKSPTKRKRTYFKCCCGSKNCRKYFFHS